MNPKLLLASLDFIQKRKKFATYFRPPFMFKIKTGSSIQLPIEYMQKVKYARKLNYQTRYVWIKTNDFYIPMISHCMIEGFGPVHGHKDPIKIINDFNKDN